MYVVLVLKNIFELVNGLSLWNYRVVVNIWEEEVSKKMLLAFWSVFR